MDQLIRVSVDVSLAILALSALIALYRAVVSRSVAEQIVVLEYMLGLIVGGIALDIIETGKSPLVDVLLIVALIGFVSAVGFTRFLAASGRDQSR